MKIKFKNVFQKLYDYLNKKLGGTLRVFAR